MDGLHILQDLFSVEGTMDSLPNLEQPFSEEAWEWHMPSHHLNPLNGASTGAGSHGFRANITFICDDVTQM